MWETLTDCTSTEHSGAEVIRVAFLEKLSPKGRLIAFDRDPQAVEVARSWTDPRFTIIHEPFSTMTESLAAIGVHQADGIFLDIGVSSPQIDDAARGFSFRFDGPLDMRMDTTRGMTAAEVAGAGRRSATSAT